MPTPKRPLSNLDEFRELTLEVMRQHQREIDEAKAKLIAEKEEKKPNPWSRIIVPIILAEVFVVVPAFLSGVWWLAKDNIQDAVMEIAEAAAADIDARVTANEARMIVLEAKDRLVPELRSLITLRCQGQQGLDSTIDYFKRLYRRETGMDYVEPPCSRLTIPNG